MEDFERELKTGFLEEATQLLTDVEQSFLELETNPGDKSNLEKIFRIAHNLKGSAKAVGFDGLGEFTHELESYLIKMKDGVIAVTSASVDLLLRCNDHVSFMIAALRDDLGAQVDYSELINELRSRIANGFGEVLAVSVAQPESEASESTDLVSQLNNVVELPILASQAEQAKSPQRQNKTPSNSDETIRVSVDRLEKLLNYVGEMVILQTVLREQSYADNPLLLRKTVHQMGKVTKEVQDLSMSLRMVPLKQTFQKMQRIVRDTSSALGKKVQLTIVGEETEVDKTVLEHLSDPLVHLIRNAVDHGVESPESRREKGKSETGEILLSAFHQGGSLVIEVRDNGGGIDADRLRQKALEKGILKPGQTIPDRDAYQLIFHSGFSTKAVVSDVSGRGVGMDVVRTNIESLQGDIQIETVLGESTCFRIRLPLTLAIIDGMVVKSNDERYVIPLSHVHESLRPGEKDVSFATGLGEVLNLRGENIPIVRLGALFGEKKHPQAHESTIIVTRTDKTVYAILIDDILGQQQVVIKQLGQEHQNLKGFSGSAILGDGRPALILEVTELIKKYKPELVINDNPRRIAV